MGEPVSPAWFAERLSSRTSRGIAVETSALIRSGELPVGGKLPPIRELAFELGISPATVSTAWSVLRRQKIIVGRGRNGSWVSGDRFVAKPERLASSGDYGTGVLNLARAVPDPSLLPPLAKALVHGASAEKLNDYERNRILPELEAAVRRRWPYEPEAFLATNGGYNAVYTLIHAMIMPGSRVAIEHPTAMRLLDILESIGIEVLPVSCDHEGPTPSSLVAALTKKPAAFLFQPRLNSVTGVTVSTARLAALGQVLAESDVLIIEDDGVGDIASSPPQSLGSQFPKRVIHILSFSKSLGPDLRLAVLSTSASHVEQIQSYRSFSAGWTSRILQSAAAWLLQDNQTQSVLERARAIYQLRRTRLCDALAARDILLPAGNGLCLWVPVASESFAMVTLAAHGISVFPGAKFSVLPVNCIRIATGQLVDRYDATADAILRAHH